MAKRKGSEALYPAIYTAQILQTMNDFGLVRLSPQNIVSLMSIANDGVPPSLMLGIMTFTAKHPPKQNDFAGVHEYIRKGCVLGVGGLLELHRYAREKQRRLDKKHGLPSARQAAKQAADAAKAAEEKQLKRDQAAALKLLPVLYEHRFSSRLKPWAAEFLECATSLTGAGYLPVPAQIRTIFELGRLLSLSV